MSDSNEKLAAFLREVSNWQWDDFCLVENNPKFTSNQAIIFALIRNAASQKLNAIQSTLNRLDGKLKTPVKVEYPKVYWLFPNATATEDALETVPGPPLAPGEPTDPTDPQPATDAAPVTGDVLPPPLPEPPEADRDLATMTLRETLTEMAEYPRELPQGILKLAEQTEQWTRNAAPEPDEIPKVKSVVAASLLTMAQNRNMNAITEVFDQIDGKLVETIQVLGDDIHLVFYVAIAPAGAKRNADGVYQVEAVETQDIWKHKLGG